MEEEYSENLIGAIFVLITYCQLKPKNDPIPLSETIRFTQIQETLAFVYGVDLQSTEGVMRITNSHQYKAMETLFYSKLNEKK